MLGNMTFRECKYSKTNKRKNIDNGTGTLILGTSTYRYMYQYFYQNYEITLHSLLQYRVRGGLFWTVFMLFLLYLYKKRIIDKFCESDITLQYSALKICVNSYQIFLTGKVMTPCSIPKSSLQNSPSGGYSGPTLNP